MLTGTSTRPAAAWRSNAGRWSTASNRPISPPASTWTTFAVRPSAVLGERPVTLPGIGQTIEVTAGAVHLPAAAPATASAIPYFQWDNRDGRAMRIWIFSADAGEL